MTIKEICENIWEVEKKYDLFNQKIQGVYFWKLVRFPTVKRITEKTGLYGQAHTSVKKSYTEKLSVLPKMLWNTYFNGVKYRKNKVDTLIFQHARKVKIGDEYIDIYTNELIKELEEKNEKFEIVDKPLLRKYFIEASQKRSYDQKKDLKYLIKRVFFKVKLTEQEEKIIDEVESELKKRFKIEFNIKDEIKKRIKLFKLAKSEYIKILEKRDVKKVFLVVSYGCEPLISACKDLKIECIEMQHGTMGKYHLGYSFPNNKEIPYFPDNIYMFGEYWYDNTPIPLKREDIKIIGYPYLENQLKRYEGIEKQKASILFISQGTIGKKLSEIGYKFAKENPNYKVTYKLHPGEYDRWQNDYPILNGAVKMNNFEVVDNNKTNLYEYIAKAEYLIGVYSTVIFEGLTLNCKTILVDLPGIEYMDYLIEKDYVKLAEDEKDIIKFISGNNFTEVDKDYFFKK